MVSEEGLFYVFCVHRPVLWLSDLTSKEDSEDKRDLSNIMLVVFKMFSRKFFCR